MDPETSKVKALTKEETKSLICLIQNSKIINNKTTNATTNKSKAEEWTRITEEFNACTSSSRRTVQQLRLKWENLKKNARKRSTMIRMNQLKTGGGVPDYVPPDEVLDMVSSLLGSTVEGFKVQFGGDAEPIEERSDDARVVLSDVVDITEEHSEISVITIPHIISDNAVHIGEQSDPINTPVIPKKLFHPVPRASGSKRRPEKRKDDDGRKERNLAMASYYISKKKYLEESYQNVLLQNEKLKLEIEELKNKLLDK